MNLHVEIDRVLTEYPALGVHGFEVNPPLRPGHDFVDQVVAARTWLVAAPARRAMLLQCHSYRIKHLVESDARAYVGNGAVIVAAVLEGFRPERGTSHRNCHFTLA